MDKFFAILPLCAVLLTAGAQAAPGGDVVLFKAKVLQQDFVSGYDVPQPDDGIILIEGGVYHFRFSVEDVLIGDLAQQTVDTETGAPGEFDNDPPRYLYVLAQKSTHGRLTVLEWSLAERGLCLDQDWKALGIAAEWRTQSALMPCKAQ